MSLKVERDLNHTNRDQVKRATLAHQSKNYDYAISLMQSVLRDEPLFLEGRRFLRAIEIQKYKALNGFSQKMISMKAGTAAMTLSGAAKKPPADQLALAEEVLMLDPYQTKANNIIGDAGVALGYPEFRAFAYETLAENRAKDKAILNTLARTYMEMKEFVKAEKTYARILDFDARDGDALSGLKDASAAHASRSGGWETAGTYRDVLKDKAESEQLEQTSKIVKSGSAIDEQIQLNYEKHQAEPANPAHSKAIAQLFLQKNDYAQAVVFFQHSFEAGGKVDSALEKTIGDLRLKQAEQELQALVKAQAAAPDPESQASFQLEIDAKVNELNEVRLFQAEARVRAQPNEGEFRYDLGNALFKMGQYKRATEELQHSLKQPSVRYQALNLMGQSFMKRNMLDFAIKQFSQAKSELLPMDELKKEVVYNLGLAYAAGKQPAKALEEFKEIYQVDMSYRDVSKRVEESYGQSDDQAA